MERDRRTLGQTGTLLERGVDFERLRRERLGKVQSEMNSHKEAHDFIQELASKLRPGLAYDELLDDLPDYPASYKEQRYPFVLHGVGTDDEPPFLAFPDEPGSEKLEGKFKENMVVSVGFYAGEVGGQDGVKLEDEVWIGPDGPVMISLYPYEEKILS